MPRSSLNSNDIALDCLLFANELLLSTHRAPSLSICQVGDQKVNASMSKNISKSSLNNVSKKGKF